MARPVQAGEDAIALAELALSRRLHKSAVKRLIMAQFKVGARTAETVISRARGRLLERTNRNVEEHRADSYSFYDSVLRDQAAPIRMKLIAQERIDRLLGLQRPERIELTGQNGGPVAVAQVDFSSLSKTELKKLTQLMEKTRNAQSPASENPEPLDVPK